MIKALAVCGKSGVTSSDRSANENRADADFAYQKGFSLDQPPLPIGLQTAAEPVMLWPNRLALSYQPVIEGLALLAVSREFPDERYLAGILRLRIAPLSGGAGRLAVHLLVDGVMDNVEVLLCQLDIGFDPKSQILRLSWQPDSEGGAHDDHSER
jgi:hypothetical protein